PGRCSGRLRQLISRHLSIVVSPIERDYGVLSREPAGGLAGLCLAIDSGLSLRKTASRGFLVAGAVTFFILSLGGLLNLLSAMYLRSGNSMVSIGSFTRTR